MKIEIKDDAAYVYTPYNLNYVNRIKKIHGAKWMQDRKCWTVPKEAVDAVREIMLDVYGYSDIVPNKTITLKVTILEEIRSLCSPVMLFGKTLAYAYGRDSGGRAGEDVYYVSGGAASGGSAKNWESVVKAGSVAVLSNVNVNIYKREEKKDNIRVEIVEQTDKPLQQQFHVLTPAGDLKAVEFKDEGKHGITLIFVDNDGNEHMACSVYYKSGEIRTEISNLNLGQALF